MSKTVTLTPALLRRIVLEEKRKILESKALLDDSPEEVEADEFADTLEAHKDFTVKENARKRYNALTLEERQLVRKLKRIRENKLAIRNKHNRR